MNALLYSGLFPETVPAELAGLAHELGFHGLDWAVQGQPGGADRTALEDLSEAGCPVGLVSCDTHRPEVLEAWAEVARAAGCRRLRCAPFDADDRPDSRWFAELAAVAARQRVTLLVPHQAGSCLRDPIVLAEFLGEHDPAHLALLLCPDQLPGWRESGHQPWLERPLPAGLGGVVVAGYRWTSELGQGGLWNWTAKAAPITHGPTPWAAWLTRLKEAGFDGSVSFGDRDLIAPPAERLRILRDDLRYLRRTWSPNPGQSRTHRAPERLPDY